MPIDLLKNVSATGAGAATGWGGGPGVFMAAGTFGGATVALQVLGPDGATWFDVGTDTTLTAPGGGTFNLPPARIRANVTAGPPTGMYATADRLGLA